MRKVPCASPSLRPASDPALPRLAGRGRQHARLRKPRQSPSSGQSPTVAFAPVLQPPSQASTCPSHSIRHPLPSPRAHLHLTLALAKVLSSELPSHMRLRAAPGHTTQGHSLQFPNFQHLGRCLQELRGRCRERGIRGCQISVQRAVSKGQGGRSGQQPSAHQPRATLPAALRAKGGRHQPIPALACRAGNGGSTRAGGWELGESQWPRALLWESGGPGSRLCFAPTQRHDPASTMQWE